MKPSRIIAPIVLLACVVVFIARSDEKYLTPWTTWSAQPANMSNTAPITIQLAVNSGTNALQVLNAVGTQIYNVNQFGSSLATTGYRSASNSYPITTASGGWAALGNCGCITWMSNATLYLVCTNSINSNATTNKLGGL